MEIVLPVTKPATEWVNGRALQKMSPQRKHALAQGVFFSALHRWAMQNGAGRVGTEWDFRIQPPGEQRRPLVPDVAYLSYARVPYDKPTDADIPHIAPDVVVEVLSPGDQKADVEEKIRVYLAAGTTVVLVDTKSEEVSAATAVAVRRYGSGDLVTTDALPGFTVPIASLFEEPRPRPTP
jgi:Uma2 family endonuclease